MSCINIVALVGHSDYFAFSLVPESLKVLIAVTDEDYCLD